jgi:hypothetical protein
MQKGARHGNSFAAGIEGGSRDDPYWNGDAVAIPQ